MTSLPWPLVPSRPASPLRGGKRCFTEGECGGFEEGLGRSCGEGVGVWKGVGGGVEFVRYGEAGCRRPPFACFYRAFMFCVLCRADVRTPGFGLPRFLSWSCFGCRFLLPALTVYLPLKAAIPSGALLFAAHHMNLQVRLFLVGRKRAKRVARCTRGYHSCFVVRWIVWNALYTAGSFQWLPFTICMHLRCIVCKVFSLDLLPTNDMRALKALWWHLWSSP